MKASTALYIGGYIWTAKSLVLVPGALAESGRPSLVVAAMIVLVIAPGVAARRLLVTSATDYRLEPLAFAAVPITVALLNVPYVAGDPFADPAGWWIGPCLPVLATITARWGLRTALAAALPTQVAAVLIALHQVTPRWQHWQQWLAALLPMLLWPLATQTFASLLRSHDRASAELLGTTSAAALRRDSQAGALDDLGRRLLQRVGPTLTTIADGGPADERLRAHCRALERRVRDEIRTRRLLADDGREVLADLLAAGWTVQVDDSGPAVMGHPDVARARLISTGVLDTCAGQDGAPGAVSIRLIGDVDRLLTVVVVADCAFAVAAGLSGFLDAEISLDGDELFAQFPIVATPPPLTSVPARSTPSPPRRLGAR